MKIKLSFIKLTIFSSLIWLNYQHTVSASGIVNHIQVNTFIEKGYQFDVKRFDDRNPKQYVFSISVNTQVSRNAISVYCINWFNSNCKAVLVSIHFYKATP